ncbi:hypothetical protein HPP92_003807 [Vanilla planifolia]|uniref:Uncharacterized protein n=1 Tax=Vanilla planifolia TaxID=51239 RepID=A0A835S3P9_VANPL|nr:hypothetical protein HPP92_003807 [Vanilla planifolia]
MQASFLSAGQYAAGENINNVNAESVRSCFHPYPFPPGHRLVRLVRAYYRAPPAVPVLPPDFLPKSTVQACRVARRALGFSAASSALRASPSSGWKL